MLIIFRHSSPTGRCVNAWQTVPSFMFQMPRVPSTNHWISWFSKSWEKLCELSKRFLTLGWVFNGDLYGPPQHSLRDFAWLLSLQRNFFDQTISVTCTDLLIVLDVTSETWTALLDWSYYILSSWPLWNLRIKRKTIDLILQSHLMHGTKRTGLYFAWDKNRKEWDETETITLWPASLFVHFTKCFKANLINEDEMYRACNTHGSWEMLQEF